MLSMRVLVPLLFVAVVGAPARGEVSLALFLGGAEIPEADLHVRRANDTDVVFADALWRDASFTDPPYYALRHTRWFVGRPRWGVAVGLTHAKAILDASAVTPARGVIEGRPVASAVAPAEAVEQFAMTHGLNSVTLGILHRWQPGVESRLGAVTWIAGVDAGAVVPHVEARVDGIPTRGYQLAGWTVEAIAGLEAPMDEHIGFTLEARLARADITVDDHPGGDLTTELLLPQLAVGVVLRR